MISNQQPTEKFVSKVDIAIKFMHAMESEQFDKVKELVSKDFIFEDPSDNKFDINYFINIH